MTSLNKIVEYGTPEFGRPYIIAEAGVNHEGSMDTAKRLIDEAKEGGADAIKFQTYKAETLASKHSPAYWDTNKEPTQSQYELFKKHDSFWKSECEELKNYCDQADILFLSTPFDVESASFLNDLMPVFKISSSDITNKPFIEYMAKLGKPIILSTGASNLDEIRDAVSWIRPFDIPLSLLHCILNYPTDDENANLAMISDLNTQFPEHVIGYSDHTLPKDMKVLEAAWLLGAQILEKHFTHDKSLPGNDHYHAMDKEDLKHFISRVKDMQKILGSTEKRALDSEAPARANARRSLVFTKDLPAGSTLQASDLTWKRPASGISPKDLEQIIGRRLEQSVEKDTVLIETLLQK